MTKLNSAGSGLGYSKYLGGSVAVDAKAIALDSSNNAYLTGDTASNNFSKGTASSNRASGITRLLAVHRRPRRGG